MSLLRENVASLYDQIASLLREEINNGLYEPSGKLPSEAQLCQRFDVSRVTVRLALNKLTEEKTVERKQGKGTYATGKQLRHGLDHLRSFHDSLMMLGLNPTMKLLSRDIVKTPEKLLSLIGPQEKTSLMLQRLHIVDSEPIALGHSYLPIQVASAGWEMTEKNPTYTILEQLTGLPVARADLAIRVGKADAASAKALKMKTGQALLVMERMSYFSNNICCDYSIFFIRPERYEFNLKTLF